MSNLLLDLKYGLRTLLKTPGFTVVAVLTLALGIGANTAIFSVIESVLLRALPYKQPDSLVLLWGDSPTHNNHRSQVSFTDVEDWRRSTTAFEDIAAYAQWNAVLNTGDLSQRVPAIQVSDAFFRVLQAKPLLGRLFVPEDQIDGKDFVIVLSHDLWRERFNSDPQVVGRTVRINASTYTVVGVLPPDFAPLPRSLVSGVTGIYRPCAETYDNKTRDNRHFRAIARLKPGVTLASAQAQMSAVAAQLSRAYPKENGGYGVRATTLREDLVGGIRPALLLLYGGVVFVLLIACANLANLLLVRFARREREIAVRSALGATQWRLIRQLATENLVLAFVGGSLGLLLGSWLVAAAQRFLVDRFPAVQSLEINSTVFLFTAVVSILAGLCFGLVPAFYSSRSGIAAALKSSSNASVGGSHGSLRNGLVITEIALALVLLACSGLLLRTVQRLQQVDPGFRTDSLVAADITLPWVHYGNSLPSMRFYDKLLDRVKAMPGVTAAGAVSTLPLTDFDSVGFKPEGQIDNGGRSPEADRYVVSPDYLQTMGIELKAGRLLNENDTQTSPSAVVISETLAHQIWPGENAIGKRLRFPDNDERKPWRTVVGIVGDVKQYSLEQQPTMQLYVSYRQEPWNYMTLVVRSNAPTADLVSALRAELKTMDADAAVSNPEMLSQILADSIQSRRLTMMLLVTFASLALLLAAVGVYGVLSYVVSYRTREIGVRIALGATQSDVLKMVLGQGLRLTLAGTVIGVALALLAGRLVSTLLFGIRPHDATTFAVITAVLIAVAVLASYIPARRATTIDPMEALRQD
jgi:putative ABC transport system permease protein